MNYQHNHVTATLVTYVCPATEKRLGTDNSLEIINLVTVDNLIS